MSEKKSYSIVLPNDLKLEKFDDSKIFRQQELSESSQATMENAGRLAQKEQIANQDMDKMLKRGIATEIITK